MASARSELVADAAIRVLAERGMRGLTHRAVDETAGLPVGSASNLARSRASLLSLALLRLADLETQQYAMSAPADPPPGDPRAAAGALVETLTLGLTAGLTTQRHLTVARFELALEATRRPELRELYDRLGRDLHLTMVDLLARAGSQRPVADARSLVSSCEGLLFYHVAGADSARLPTEDELRGRVGELVAPLTAPTAAPDRPA